MQKTSQQVNTFLFLFCRKIPRKYLNIVKTIAATMVHPFNCSLLILVVMCIVLHGIEKVIH